MPLYPRFLSPGSECPFRSKLLFTIKFAAVLKMPLESTCSIVSSPRRSRPVRSGQARSGQAEANTPSCFLARSSGAHPMATRPPARPSSRQPDRCDQDTATEGRCPLGVVVFDQSTPATSIPSPPLLPFLPRPDPRPKTYLFMYVIFPSRPPPDPPNALLEHPPFP